jgi:hypothetical protein
MLPIYLFIYLSMAFHSIYDPSNMRIHNYISSEEYIIIIIFRTVEKYSVLKLSTELELLDNNISLCNYKCRRRSISVNYSVRLTRKTSISSAIQYFRRVRIYTIFSRSSIYTILLRSIIDNIISHNFFAHSIQFNTKYP